MTTTPTTWVVRLAAGLLALALLPGCGEDDQTTSGAQVTAGGRSASATGSDLATTSEAVVRAVRGFVADGGGDGDLPRALVLEASEDGSGTASELTVRGSGTATIADPGLRPGVELGWYVPYPLPDLGDLVDRGTGFAFCLVDPTAHQLTSVELAEDGSEVTVRPGGPPACGEPPPAGPG